MSYEPSLSKDKELSKDERERVSMEYITAQQGYRDCASAKRESWERWGKPRVEALDLNGFAAFVDALLFFCGMSAHATKIAAIQAVMIAPPAYLWRALEHGFKAENDAVVRSVTEAHEKRDDESERMGDWCAFDKELRIHERD